MDRVLKVLATQAEQLELAKEFRHLEHYEAFVLLEAPAEVVDELERRGYAVEDLTDRFVIPGNQEDIDTSEPWTDGQGRPSHWPEDEVMPAPTGRHHYLVQFKGPIKSTWLTAVEDAGGEPREPHSSFTYVVRASGVVVDRIAALPFVRWVGHLRYADRVAPTVHEREGEMPVSARRVRRLEDVYTVQFLGAEEVVHAKAAVRRLGFDVVVQAPAAGILIVQSKPDAGHLDPERIAALARIHGVREVRPRTLGRFSDDIAAGLMGVVTGQGPAHHVEAHDNLDPFELLDGEGEYVGVCDSGLDTGERRTMHPDFSGRVAYLKSYPISKEHDKKLRNPRADDGPADRSFGHGTHTAGAILGDGKASGGPCGIPANNGVCSIPAPIRGLAPKARLVFQAIEQEALWKTEQDLLENGSWGTFGLPEEIYPLFQDAYRARARVHTNAWNRGNPGEYDEYSRGLDEFVWDHKNFCILVSAGNDAVDRNADGEISLGTVLPPGTAKNCITVGACESERPDYDCDTYGSWWPRRFPVSPYSDDPMADNPNQVAAFSGRGPTRDQRNKPDVVAPGTFILSTRSSMLPKNNKAWSAYPYCERYFYMGGTSPAVALAAGIVVLVRQHVRRTGIKQPSAALLKAALIAGATRLGVRPERGPMVDRAQGFGRVNLARIVAPDPPVTVRFIDVRRGLASGASRKLRIQVLSDSEPLRVVLAYSDYPGASLVNNLNVEATDPEGRTYAGNQPLEDSRSRDYRNNVELIEIPTPRRGNWTISVVASDVKCAYGRQDFAIVLRGALSDRT